MMAVVATAAAQDVELPSAPGSTLPEAAAPAPTTAQPAAPAPRPRRAAVRLSVGSRGPAVRDLQRELRRRGLRLAVDGVFGRATKRAVIRIQRRLKMRPTGVATAALLRRLGLRTRAVAGSPARTGLRSSSYLRTFPVQGTYTYFDDYGAPRHQGRHQGIDIMAARGTPVVAVANAVVHRLSRAESGLGGIWVWLRRADGTEYYYAHLHSIADGLDAGAKVTVGQVIGSVGNTGDARYGAPHLHFEIRRGGRTPINPYPHLVAVDPAKSASARSRARAGS